MCCLTRKFTRSEGNLPLTEAFGLKTWKGPRPQSRIATSNNSQLLVPLHVKRGRFIFIEKVSEKNGFSGSEIF